MRGCEVVLHLAALISIPHSYRAPEAFVATNVTGTLNVLEAGRRSGSAPGADVDQRGLRHAGRLPITEDHPLRGAVALQRDQDRGRQALRGVRLQLRAPGHDPAPVQHVRATPVHPGRHPHDPRAAADRSTELRLGRLAPQRDFTFVTDTARAFVLTAQTDVDPGTVVQLGTGVAVSVGDVVDAAGRLLGVTPTVVTHDERVRPDASEVQVLLSDPALAVTTLGWKPEADFLDGLAVTATWLRGSRRARGSRRLRR